MFEEMGVKVHVVISGAHKGAGTPGAPITAGQLEPYQELVDGLSQLFQAAVSRGRNLSADSVKELASGRDWLAARARELKLCDFVESRGEMLARIGEYGPVPAMKR
jgi:ClpP class serine protease